VRWVVAGEVFRPVLQCGLAIGAVGLVDELLEGVDGW